MNSTIRAQFPLLEDLTYLNSAAVCIMPLVSQEAGQRWRESVYRKRPDALDVWRAEMELTRRTVADFIGAQPAEIAFTGNTGDGEAFVAGGLDFKPGGNIVIDDLEYPSGHITWRETAQRYGLTLREAKSVAGVVGIEQFAALVDDRTQLVAVSYVSHHNGFCHDMHALAALAHAHGAYLFADATQAVGALPVAVRAIDVDFLICATYKWTLGPFGLAFFYCKSELLDRLRLQRWGWMQSLASDAEGRPLSLQTDARKFEYGTLPFQGFAELQASLQFLNELGQEPVQSRIVALNQRLQHGLRAIGAQLWTPPGNRSGMVTIHKLDAQRIGAALERERIITAPRPAPRNQIRISANFYNTEAEIDRCVASISQLL